jgi:hypothetical protein
MRKTLCGGLLVAALVVPVAVQASPIAYVARAHACNIRGKQRKLGTTYVTSVKVSRVSCSRALRFVKAYHKCRHKHGAAGRCRRLRGYKCSEKREAIPTQYDSRATCSKGRRRITQTYTQNT